MDNPDKKPHGLHSHIVYIGNNSNFIEEKCLKMPGTKVKSGLKRSLADKNKEKQEIQEKPKKKQKSSHDSNKTATNGENGVDYAGNKLVTEMESGLNRNLDERSKEREVMQEKPKKKQKSCKDENKTATKEENGFVGNAVPKLDTSIFQHFTNLTQDDENGRIEAAVKLIQTLQRSKEPEKRQKELSYALKRLIRGCGAATNASRSGFFTGLVAFLKTFKSEEVEMNSIFDTMQKELHVGATLTNKEDADAVVGKILVCGALLRSGRISELKSEQLESITNLLLQASHHRSYHTSLSYAFLIEIFETALTVQQFEDSVWPLLSKELTKPWLKQTLQTVHCLMVAQKKFPTILNAKYFKTHFGGRELLNAESYEHLKRIFWSHSDMQVITHPAFEIFGVYLANCQNLEEFWTQTVDTCIKTPTKLSEFLTLKIASDILQNLPSQNAGNIIVKLLTSNFMKMLLNGLKHIKVKKDDTLKAFYDDFMEALVACCSKLPDGSDQQKTTIIRRLILYPGSFGIEKLTSTRVVHQLINSLSFEGVQDIYFTYKQIFCGTLQKQTDETNKEDWQHFERLNAGFMLQHLLAHKAVQHNKDSYEWRREQLRFLLFCGVFHVQQKQNSSIKSPKYEDILFEACKKDAACSFSKEFGEQCKNMFYTSLQSKQSNLKQERELNLTLVQSCDEYMQKTHHKRYLRIKLTDENEKLLASGWQKMTSTVGTNSVEEGGKKSKKSKSASKANNGEKLELVFHIMLLNMGLQLFREPDMAEPAITDLIKCMERTKKNPRSKSNMVENEDNEPDWIEVVIDLFLHLLSQNAGALRSSVNHLFPHFCNNLNVNAIHQILSVLDMKDGLNPLSRKGEEDDDDKSDDENNKEENMTSNDEDEEEEEEADSGNEDDAGNEEEEEDSEEDGDSDDDDENDADEDDEDEADITANDKLRNAISQALMANGAVVNGAENNDDDDDEMASVDLNDMTEEEGRRLDEALAAAFKAMKKPSNSQGGERKKTKSQRVETTTVMHFRIRVLDLIDIYIQQPEINLLNHIEIMLTLYNMLEYCRSEELKPLQAKVEKVLQKLTASKSINGKHSSQRTVNVDDIAANDLVNYIRQLAEKKTPAIAFDITNSIRNRCIVFLVNNASKVSNADEDVLKLCIEYQREFLNSRNPTVNITLLSEIYKLRWPCVWKLGEDIVEKGLAMTTRAFRRIQTCEILTILYRNNELQKIDEKTAQKYLNKFERCFVVYIEELTNLWKQPKARQSHKEFQTLLEVLLQAQRAHNRLKTDSIICSSETCEKVQNLRRHIRLESAQIYQRYCSAFKLTIIRNTEVVAPPIRNGKIENSDSETEETTSETKKPKQKKDTDANSDRRKEKKLKKMERMLAASKGINGGFSGNVDQENEEEE